MRKIFLKLNVYNCFLLLAILTCVCFANKTQAQVDTTQAQVDTTQAQVDTTQPQSIEVNLNNIFDSKVPKEYTIAALKVTGNAHFDEALPRDARAKPFAERLELRLQHAAVGKLNKAYSF